MNAAWLVLLAGCARPQTRRGPAEQDTALPPDSRSTSAVLDGPSWEIAEVAGGYVTGLAPGPDAVHNPADGWAYALAEDGSAAWYLTSAWVHPSGTWCLDGTGEACAGGTEWEAGTLLPSASPMRMCLDGDNGRLFLIARDGSLIEVADVSPAGEDPRTYLQLNGLIRPPAELAALGTFNGPCAYLPALDALALTAPAEGLVAVIATADGDVLGKRVIGASPSRVAAWSDGAGVVLDDPAAGWIMRLEAATLDTAARVEPGAPIVDWALDPGTGVVWAALGDAGAAGASLKGSGSAAWTVPVEGSVLRAFADPSTGLGWFATADTLALALADEVVATRALGGTVVGGVQPSAQGDLALFLQDGDGSSIYAVFDAVRTPADARPPVYAWIIATIEEPFDADIDKACEGESGSVQAQIQQIEANAAVLAGMGVPVALAITHNFASVAERCGFTGIFQALADLGFELGVMVHNRPGYNCVNAEDAATTEAERCERGSPYACDPDAGADCTFPGDEDYCPLGDWDCYIHYIDARNVVIDRNIPGGGAFVLGADRHNMWSWDWVRAYAEMERADGSRGFDVAMFAHAWAYAGEVTLEDPRSKNPAPWRPGDAVRGWAPVSSDDWTVDSAFQQVLYLPGYNTATIKAGEFHASGLYMQDLLATDTAFLYDEDDFAVLSQVLRSSISLRSEDGPNTWYFHIHDLSTANLANADGSERDGAALLRAWLATVPAEAEARGELVWAFPSEVRAAWTPPSPPDTGD